MFKKKLKNKRFDFIPRYYDPVKEELEERLGKYSDEKGNINLTKSNIRAGLRRKSRGSNVDVSASNRQSNIRLISIILVLAFLTYLIFKSDVFLSMVESLSG